MNWLIDILTKMFNGPKPVYQPVSKVKISLTELNALISTKFPGVPLYLSDREYTLCHYDDLAYFLAENQVNKIDYQPEVMDCDDFAAALWGQFSLPPWSGLTVGLVWTDLHALNIVVTEDRKIYFLEPQTDEFKEQLAAWQGSQLRVILI